MNCCNPLDAFLSPVSGRSEAPEDYILEGNAAGVAVPSPSLIDIRLDLIQLTRDTYDIAEVDFVIGFGNPLLPYAQVLSEMNNGFMYNTGGIVSTLDLIPSNLIDLSLQQYHLFIGDENNKASEQLKFKFRNMQELYLSTPGPVNVLNTKNFLSALYDSFEGDGYSDLATKALDLKNKVQNGNFTGLVGDFTELYNIASDNGLVDLVKNVFNIQSQLLRGQIYRASQANNGDIVASDDLTNAENNIDINTEQIQNINEQIQNIQEQIQNIQEQIQNITDQLQTINQQISNLQTQYNTLQEVVNNIVNQVADIYTQIDSIFTQLGSLFTQLGSLSGIVSGLVTAVGALQTGLAALATTVAGLGGAVAGIQDQILNLRLNKILADDHVSFYGYKLINLADPTDPTDGVNLRTLNTAINNLRLNNITVDGDVNIGGHKIINVGNGTNPGDAANIGTVTTIATTIAGAAAGAAIATLHIDGAVTGGPPDITGKIIVSVEHDMDFQNHRLKNLKQSPEEDFDAISMTFLWDLMHDEVEILWP